jgi:hypothetical protein
VFSNRVDVAYLAHALTANNSGRVSLFVVDKKISCNASERRIETQSGPEESNRELWRPQSPLSASRCHASGNATDTILGIFANFALNNKSNISTDTSEKSMVA